MTKTELLSCKNDVYLALGRGEDTTVVLINQSAVLDCLRSWFGVGDVVLDLFKSYHSDHL